MRQFGAFETLICKFDAGLRTLNAPTQRAHKRKTPADAIINGTLTSNEERHVAGLMRVNHSGEVAAQALYQGQALTAKLTTVKTQMTEAAEEEIDHLAWCEQRLAELNSKPSLLNPIWYSGSFIIGALAGLAGDKWSLGFVMETERQVSSHLQKHLDNLPAQDMKSKAILTKMQEDETHHATMANNAGANELPHLIKFLMQSVSKLLTKSSYHI